MLFVSINIGLGHVQEHFTVRRPALVKVVGGRLAGHQAGHRIIRRIKLEHLKPARWRREGREHYAVAGWMPGYVPVDVVAHIEEPHATAVELIDVLGIGRSTRRFRLRKLELLHYDGALVVS